MEIELCAFAQGYKNRVWSLWLKELPSPFFWFRYETKLKKIIGKEKGGKEKEW